MGLDIGFFASNALHPCFIHTSVRSLLSDAICAVIGRKEIMDAAQGSWISSTFWTERIGPTAALAAMKKLYFKLEVAITGDWDSLTRLDDTKAPIKVTIDKKGVLKLSGKFGGNAISGSTTLLPETDGSLTGYLPISVKPKSGCVEYYLFRFTYKDGVPRLDVKVDGPCG